MSVKRTLLKLFLFAKYSRKCCLHVFHGIRHLNILNCQIIIHEMLKRN